MFSTEEDRPTRKRSRTENRPLPVPADAPNPPPASPLAPSPPPPPQPPQPSPLPPQSQGESLPPSSPPPHFLQTLMNTITQDHARPPPNRQPHARSSITSLESLLAPRGNPPDPDPAPQVPGHHLMSPLCPLPLPTMTTQPLSLENPPLPRVSQALLHPQGQECLNSFLASPPSMLVLSPSLLHPTARNTASQDPQPLPRQTSANPPSPAIVSAPLRHPSNRRSIKNSPDSSPDTPVASSSARPHLLGIPAITHTPATPLSSPGNISPVTPRLPSRPSHHHVLKNGSLDAGYRYRGGNMGVVDEEDRAAAVISKSRSLKGKGREIEAVPRTDLTKISTSARATKHGSFDFERPGWGTTMIQRTGSNGTSGTTGSTWSKSGDSGPKERESTWGPGLAGVGTLQRDISLKRSKDREDQIVMAKEARKRQETDRDKAIASQRSTPHGSQSDHAANSTSTNGTGITGKSSSMSRATGKRSMFSGKSGRLGLSTQHGLFDFEPPVPSPTGSSHDHSASWNGRGEKDRQKEEKGQRKGVHRIGDRPPVPVPLPSNVGHRSGTKGRSLDLGLGLAWAPSRMREDALLPSSTFARSLTNSSCQLGRSASGSTNSHGSRSKRVQIEDAVEGSNVGKEVAGLFRAALDADGYTAFKKYVHQFDAHEIPFDGPAGIITRVERLLRNSRTLEEDAKKRLLDRFIRIILQNA
ncbi:hypothetical protein BDQ17DRAFT_1351902 [Cyathus striatus]|nr:hypothetical protein BDQ17DRAFT_1351902 [Cyathus striatus]